MEIGLSVHSTGKMFRFVIGEDESIIKLLGYQGTNDAQEIIDITNLKIIKIKQLPNLEATQIILNYLNVPVSTVEDVIKYMDDVRISPLTTQKRRPI